MTRGETNSQRKKDEYSILSSHHASSMNGYVLVYSISSKSSFDMIKIIRDKILDFTGLETVPCVIVGNKTDLNIQRQVSTEEGKELAQQWNCPFVETSAKHDENVCECLFCIICALDLTLNSISTTVAKIFDSLIASIEKANNPPLEEKGGCVTM